MPSQNKEVLCTYHYDPLDCLIGLSAKQDTLQRFYCKSRLATEIQGLVRCSIMQQGDLLLAQQKGLGNTLETALLATDQQRSVMHTDGGNSLAIAYSPYGHRRADNGLTSLLGFNGERPEAITGHYLLGNGYRAFNPMLMRFNSPDGLSPFGKGGLNSYAYCLGDPVNLSDPTGNTPWFLLLSNSFQRSKKDFMLWPDHLSGVMVKKYRDLFSVKAGGLFQRSDYNFVWSDSRAAHKLSQWKASPRTPEVIAVSKANEKIDFSGPIFDLKKNSELIAYGDVSAVKYNLIGNLPRHIPKQRLVIDDLKAVFKEQPRPSGLLDVDRGPTISPSRARSDSAKAAEKIRQGGNTPIPQ